MRFNHARENYLDVSIIVMVNLNGVMRDLHTAYLGYAMSFCMKTVQSTRVQRSSISNLFMGGINAGYVQLCEHPARCWSGTRSHLRIEVQSRQGKLP